MVKGVPTRRAGKSSIDPPYSCPVPSARSSISSRNRRRISILVIPSLPPSHNPPSFSLHLPLSLRCHVPAYLEDSSHAPCVSLTLPLPAGGPPFSPPSTSSVILFLSFSRLSIYLSIYLRLFPFRYLPIHLFVCRSIPDLATLSFCGSSSGLPSASTPVWLSLCKRLQVGL